MDDMDFVLHGPDDLPARQRHTLPGQSIYPFPRPGPPQLHDPYLLPLPPHSLPPHLPFPLPLSAQPFSPSIAHPASASSGPGPMPTTPPFIPSASGPPYELAHSGPVTWRPHSPHPAFQWGAAATTHAGATNSQSLPSPQAPTAAPPQRLSATSLDAYFNAHSQPVPLPSPQAQARVQARIQARIQARVQAQIQAQDPSLLTTPFPAPQMPQNQYQAVRQQRQHPYPQEAQQLDQQLQQQQPPSRLFSQHHTQLQNLDLSNTRLPSFPTMAPSDLGPGPPDSPSTFRPFQLFPPSHCPLHSVPLTPSMNRLTQPSPSPTSQASFCPSGDSCPMSNIPPAPVSRQRLMPFSASLIAASSALPLGQLSVVGHPLPPSPSSQFSYGNFAEYTGAATSSLAQPLPTSAVRFTPSTSSSGHTMHTSSAFGFHPRLDRPDISAEESESGNVMHPNLLATHQRRRAVSSRSRRPNGSGSQPHDDRDRDHDSEDDDFESTFLSQLVSMTPYRQHDENTLRTTQMLRGASSTKMIASTSAISSLISVDIADLPQNERNCVICYNDYGVQCPEGFNEAPLQLPVCKHVFGDHCIKKWFEDSDSCPYCRHKVPSEPQMPPGTRALLNLVRMRSGNSQHALAGIPEDIYLRLLRRADESLASSRASRPWPTERRSPPSEGSDTRRRMRPRHGARGPGSPPSLGTSGRPNSYTGPSTSTQYQSPSREARLGTVNPILSLGSPQRRLQTTRTVSIPAVTVRAPGFSRDGLTSFHNGRNGIDPQGQVSSSSVSSQSSLTVLAAIPTSQGFRIGSVGDREDSNAGVFGNRLFRMSPIPPPSHALDEPMHFSHTRSRLGLPSVTAHANAESTAGNARA